MTHKANRALRTWAFPILLAMPMAALAQQQPSACVELGALAWDNWTKTEAGGSGLPAGESDSDYLRCKSCHGWDRLGLDGGYVRRSRTEGRPNAGAGDSDTSSRNISPGLGNSNNVTGEQILHRLAGRSYAQGSGSWIPLDAVHSAANKAAHAEGYTMGNQHPDFAPDGANAGDTVLTQQQVDCLAEFINFADADPATYFLDINTRLDPVLYTLNSGGNSAAGAIFYGNNCEGCHGDPASDHVGANNGLPEGGILAYLAEDGKFSEFVHKARWGIPDTIMSRDAIGSPDSQDMIDLMQHLQELGGTGFAITGGISGTWYSAARDGEGFLIDVAPMPQGWEFVVSYYTYDGFGNQVWLLGNATASGNQVITPMQITEGGVFGNAFDKEDIVRIDWGELEFVMEDCGTGHVWVTPNDAMLASGMGFEAFHYEIKRLTPPDVCP